MNFEKIAERISSTPRHPSGRLLLGEGLLEWLFGPRTRAWFLACRAWAQGGPAPDTHPVLTEFLANLDPFRRKLACLHINAAGLLLKGTAARISPGDLDALAREGGCAEGAVRDLLLEFESPAEKLVCQGELTTGAIRTAERSQLVTALLLEWRGNEAESCGIVADLRLEFVPAGRGECYPVPALLFLLRDPDFHEANECALKYLLTHESWPAGYDLRWRLARRDQQAVTSLLVGKSLGACFGFGLEKLMANEAGPLRGFFKMAFAGVAICAVLKPDGTLAPVDGFLAKLLAAAGGKIFPRVHTVIVSAEQAIELPGLESDPRRPQILVEPRQDLHVIKAATMKEAVELVLTDEETRWHGIDCQLPPPNLDFVGREALFDYVRDWIDRTDCGYLVLEGDMGLGKSAFIATLLHKRRTDGEVPIFHIINSPHSGTSEQIATCLYARLRRKHGLRESPEWAQLKTEHKLEHLLSVLSERLLAEGRKEVIIIEAADQAELPPNQPLVPGALSNLPRQILCIISSRFGLPWLHEQVQLCQMAELVNDKADVATYLRQKSPKLSTPLGEQFIEQIINQTPLPVFFTVVSCIDKLQDKNVADDVKREIRTNPSRWNKPPRELIEKALERRRKQLVPLVGEEEFWLTLGLVAVVREQLNRTQLEELGLLNSDRRKVLDRCAGLFHLAPNPTHPQQPYVFSHPGYGREIVERLTQPIFRQCHRLLAQGCEAARPLANSAACLYARRHWTTHLRHAGDLDRLAQALTDPQFLEEFLGTDSAARVLRPGNSPMPPPGTVFDLLRHFQRALSILPGDHPNRSNLWALSQLLDEYSNLLQKDPSLLPQLAWNDLSTDSRISTPLRESLQRAVERSRRPWLKLVRQSAHGKSPLIRTMAHGGPVTCVAFSGDGRLLASGGKDNTVRLWDARTGECRGTFKGHQGAITAVAFSPSNQCLASAGMDDSIYLWKIPSGSLIRTIKADAGGVLSLAFSRDGKVLVTGGAKGWVQFWDPENGALRRQRTEHGGAVKCLAVCPQGQFVASGGEDRTIRIWALPDGEWQRTLRGNETWVESLAFTHDGKALVSGGGFNQGEIRFWDALTGNYLRMLPGHLGGVCSLAFSPDGRKLASGSYDHNVLVRYVSTGACLPPMGHAEKVEAVAFSPDGTQLASGSDDCTVRIWDASGQPQVQEQLADLESLGQSSEPAIHSLALAPDLTTAVTGGENCLVKLWDVERGCLKGVLSGHMRNITCVAMAPDNQTIASGSLHELRQWTVQLAALSPILRGHRSWVLAAAYSDDGRLIVTGGLDGQVMLWEAATGAWLDTLSANQNSVHAVAFSPGARWAASGGTDGTVSIWDASSRQLHRSFAAHKGEVTSLVFAPEGHTLVASGGSDENVQLLDYETGQTLPVIGGQGGKITALAFSSNARWLASGCTDFTVKIYDVQTGELLAWMPCLDTVLALCWVNKKPLLQVADAGGALHIPHFYLMELIAKSMAGGLELRSPSAGHELAMIGSD